MSAVSDFIAAGESLYTEVSGGAVSATAAANINDAGTVVDLVVSLVSRNTSINLDGILTGLTSVVTGVTTIIQDVKAKATTTTTAAAAA